jgi:hypothetical protein
MEIGEEEIEQAVKVNIMLWLLQSSKQMLHSINWDDYAMKQKELGKSYSGLFQSTILALTWRNWTEP